MLFLNFVSNQVSHFFHPAFVLLLIFVATLESIDSLGIQNDHFDGATMGQLGLGLLLAILLVLVGVVPTLR